MAQRTKTRVTLLCLALLLACSANARAYQSHQFAHAVVSIHNPALSEMGSGVIVGVSGNEVRVITAGHVVDKAQTVSVTASLPDGTRTNVQASVRKRDKYYDFALVTFVYQDFPWEPFTWVSNLEFSDPVFIISTRLNGQVLPLDAAGQVVDHDREYVVARIRGIEGGDSGSALWCNHGLVGMIFTKSPVQAVSVHKIRAMLMEWSYGWNLTEVSVSRSAVVKESMPDVDREAIIPVAKIIADSECWNLSSRIIDGKPGTFYQCRVRHTVTFTLQFGSPRTVRRIKYYLPHGSNDELPRGQVALQGVPKAIDLGKIIANRSEAAADGDWYVYDLGKLYVTDHLKITIKGGYDRTKELADEIRVYEIVVTGFTN